MKPSSYCILFIMTLLSESYASSRAMSATKMEDGSSEQDVLSPFLSEEEVDNGLSPLPASRYMVLAIGKATKGGDLKIIVVDTGIWKGARALARGLSLYKFQDPEAAQPPENIMTMERRGADQDVSSGIAIARRNTMRCMVGRVYRPCWEV
ncbi:pro-melanin-concentrating hormone, like [Anguilla anguilla]|uniref:pro-melanin-concentrating hormone, like n=1 Tax=Anguilla anguilla TaxID=7936 RepID=UPI0015B183A7|nr:pro-melanin-concentrating hormone, like [Anguilla anguilla]